MWFISQVNLTNASRNVSENVTSERRIYFAGKDGTFGHDEHQVIGQENDLIRTLGHLLTSTLTPVKSKRIVHGSDAILDRPDDEEGDQRAGTSHDNAQEREEDNAKRAPASIVRDQRIHGGIADRCAQIQTRIRVTQRCACRADHLERRPAAVALPSDQKEIEESLLFTVERDWTEKRRTGESSKVNDTLEFMQSKDQLGRTIN